MGRGARMAGKWLLAPAAAGVLGYTLVGPRLAGHTRLVQAVQERVGTIAPSMVPKSPESSEMPTEPPPEPRVTVTAKLAEEAPSDDAPRPKRRRRRREQADPP